MIGPTGRNAEHYKMTTHRHLTREYDKQDGV